MDYGLHNNNVSSKQTKSTSHNKHAKSRVTIDNRHNSKNRLFSHQQIKLSIASKKI